MQKRLFTLVVMLTAIFASALAQVTTSGIRRVCQNSLILKKSQSPDFHKPGLCYV